MARPLAGHLFQGRYKSVLVDKNEYLSVLFRYIHLNPVRIKSMEKAPVKDRIKRLCRYPWSSSPGFIDKRKKEWYTDYAMVLGQSILGGEAFIAWVKEHYIDGMKGPEIGGLFGIDYGPVSQERKRLWEKLPNDRKLRALLSRRGGILSTNG